MIRIGQIKLTPGHSEAALRQKVAKMLRIPEKDILQHQKQKQSVDARKKPDISYVYTVDVRVAEEASVLKRQKDSRITSFREKAYVFPEENCGECCLTPRIIGSGPAGLFCAYMLALHGFKPVLYERGASVEERVKDIEKFWQTGQLCPNSNVQFGEGGAGTFSDGKLNTLIKDKDGRNRKVLEIFVENGAPSDILYVNKPHIGTDILIDVVRNMRNRIIELGGEVHFKSQLTDLRIQDGKLVDITIWSEGKKQIIPADILVLAIGHSARDTFQMLYEKKLPMTPKAFALGVRIEHLQDNINESQYGSTCPYDLPAAAYKVATTLENGRGVYSFCMCPGGYVVNASSEEERLSVNGMSYHARDGRNANSAIVVTVTPEDYGSSHPLSGIAFQRDLEARAYQAGGGNIPVQCFKDFCENRETTQPGNVIPQTKGAYSFANVRAIFPEELASSIEAGIKSFDRQIHGFANDDAILSAVESRTSSPVRILRNDRMEIENTGIYPCGEGAGYAGGITSAAVDGIKTAEMIAKKCRHFLKKI